MNEIVKIWYLFSISFGIWTSLNLLISPRGDVYIKRSMMCFILLLLLPPSNAYITLVLQHPVDWLQAISFKLTWTYGPLMLIHVRSIFLHKTPRHELVLHALPFVFAVTDSLFEYRWLSMGVLNILLFVQLFSYLGYCAYLLYQHKNGLKQLTRQHHNTTYYWLLFLVGGLVFVSLFDVCIYIAAYLHWLNPLSLNSTIASLVAVYINTIALFSLYQPEIFVHEPPADVVEEPVKVNVRIIELTPQAAIELDGQLQQLVRDHKPHLDEDISLNKLAALLGVTTHQLSELLNVHKQTSFYDFLNDLRYQESLQLLENQSAELTIADIAYRSGFNNRNSFYKVFKDKTGVTPTQYKKAQR